MLFVVGMKIPEIVEKMTRIGNMSRPALRVMGIYGIIRRSHADECP